MTATSLDRDILVSTARRAFGRSAAASRPPDDATHSARGTRLVRYASITPWICQAATAGGEPSPVGSNPGSSCGSSLPARRFTNAIEVCRDRQPLDTLQNLARCLIE